MKPAPIPTDESDRLSELKALNILDTPREPRFDRITELVADVFGVPMVFLTWWTRPTMVQVHHGINVEATPRDVGFCAHAMLEPQEMVVPNATKDARFADNPFVTAVSVGRLPYPR